MSDLLIDADVAEDLASSITDVDLSGASAVPFPANMSINGAISAALLGDDMNRAFTSLSAMIASKADNLREIAETMIHADATIAQGIGL